MPFKTNPVKAVHVASAVTLSLLFADCLFAPVLRATTTETTAMTTISKARITDRDKSGNGALRITVDDKERIHVPRGVSKAWVIEDGGALTYTLDGGHAGDFHTHLLLRHDELGSGDGDQELMGRFSEIIDVRVSHSNSGKAALIVYGVQDATGSPTAAVVHPTRGVVWRGVPARIVGLREGKVVIAEYAPEGGGSPKDKPLRTRSLDIDALLTRPVLKPGR